MLEFVDSEQLEKRLLDVCRADCFGTCIAASIKAYPPQENICRFWLQGSRAAICSNGGAVTICAGSEADFDEISHFLSFIGFFSLLSNAKTVEKLRLNGGKSGIVMASCGSGVDEKTEKPETTADFRAVFGLLGLDGCFDDWFADIACRIRAGTADMRIIRLENVIVSTASALHISREKQVIGAVASAVEHRDNGYASRLVGALTTASAELLCNRELESFYNRLGYKKAGEWTEIKQK